MKKVTLASLVLTVLLASIQPLYAQVQDQWATTGTMQDGRELSAQVLMKTGSVLSTGGVDHNNDILASAEVYSPASGTWKLNGSMAEARESRARQHRFRYGRVVRSDHRTLAPTGTLSVARFGHTATLLSSGKVLVAGGCMDSLCSTETAVSELYDPTSIPGQRRAVSTPLAACTPPCG